MLGGIQLTGCLYGELAKVIFIAQEMFLFNFNYVYTNYFLWISRYYIWDYFAKIPDI